jgi:hypothetical protein
MRQGDIVSKPDGQGILKTVALFYDHWIATRNASVSFRRPFRLWKKVVWYKANPRTADYMATLLKERYPGAQLLEVSEQMANVSQADLIVLLYPDSIGLGFSSIERELVRVAPGAQIKVLNGRRRQFAFDGPTRRALRFRRFLEWTMLVECAFGGVLLITTPFLLLYDMVRGRT